MRIFVGIDLEEEIRTKIARFLDGVRGFAPDARWVPSESLHVTLKFIGEQTPEQVAAVVGRLESVQGNRTAVRLSGHGFFPTAKASRVFWIGIHAGPELAELAGSIDSALGELQIPREERSFRPHLTLARGRGGSGAPKWSKGDGPNSTFAELQKRLAAMSELDFGTLTVREFFLYQSRLYPGGSKYTKLQGFPLS